jgi:hypothetical protein
MRSRVSIVSLVSLSGMLLSAGIVLAASTGILMPSNDGYYAQWTKSGGTYHYQNVDELNCNGVTDYNYTNVLGRKDSYRISLASLPSYATITSIEVSPCAWKAIGANNPTLYVQLRWQGTDKPAVKSYVLKSTTYAQLATSTFSGLNWSKTPSSTLEAIVKYASGTSSGVAVSNVRVRINY